MNEFTFVERDNPTQEQLQAMAEHQTRQAAQDRRDRFAAAALQGLIANPQRICKPRESAEACTMYADALIAELDKEQK